MAAGEGEQPADAVRLQAARDEPAAVQRRGLRGGHGGAGIYPPSGGFALSVHWRPERLEPTLAGMEHIPTKEDLSPDLELLLLESDPEDPILPEPLYPSRPLEDEIDSQIIAALVHP